MSFCPNCGAQLADDSVFCTQCGANLSEAEAQQQEPTYVSEPVAPKPNKSLSIQCMVFAIVALLMAEMCASFSFIVGLPLALVFASLSKKRRNAWIDLSGADNGFTKAGNIMSKIAIPVSIVLSVIFAIYGIIYIVIYGAMIGGAASGGDLGMFEDIFDIYYELIEGIIDFFEEIFSF